MNAITIIKDNLQSIAPKFATMARMHNAVNLDAEITYACMALKANDFLASVAQSNPESIQSAVLSVAGVGISLNPVDKHAYLVPRKVGKKMAVCLDVSYMGLTHLAVKTGSVSWVHAEAVRENDDFIVATIGDRPVHKYKAFGGNRGEITGVYCVAKLSDGSFLTRTMEKSEVDGIMQRSEAYKAFKKGNIKSCPWTTDYEEMAKKTVIKRAAKTWPRGDARLQKAIDIVNHHEGINFENEKSELPSPEPIDYEEREIQLEKILSLFTNMNLGKSRDKKIAFLKKHTGFTSFDDVKIQGNKNLDKIIMSLTTEMTADQTDEKNNMPFLPAALKEDKEIPKMSEKPRSVKDATFTIK